MCQNTGQLTCSNLTDISKYPNNTNVLFTNVFDNQIDFSRVDYLALESVMVTTAPPPAPTVLVVGFGGAVPGVSNTYTNTHPLFVVLAAAGVAYEKPEGDINVTMTLPQTSIPQLLTGQTLQNPTEIQAAFEAYSAAFSDPTNLAVTMSSTSSLGTYLSLQVNTDGQYPTTHMNYTLPQVSGELIECRPDGGEFDVLRPGTLTVEPVGNWDNSMYATFGAPTNFFLQEGDQAFLAMHKTPDPVFSGSTTAFTLQATMSDASVVPLGRFSFGCNVDPNPSVASQTMAKYGDQYTFVMGLQLPYTGLFDGSNPKWDGHGIFWRGSPPNPTSSSELPPHTNITHQLMQPSTTADTYAIFDDIHVRPSSPPELPEPRRMGLPTRIAPRFEAEAEAPPHKRIKLAAPTPTVDNILQIVCSELEVDRTAGSYSTQLLAVVPFDFAQLTTGFYHIPVPVNSLVWRRLADIHVRSLTFGIFNGYGEPQAALAGQDYTITLGLRYR